MTCWLRAATQSCTANDQPNARRAPRKLGKTPPHPGYETSLTGFVASLLVFPRCRRTRHDERGDRWSEVSSHQGGGVDLGRIERFAEGRIRYVSENLGRLLFVVEWERGGASVLFPEEISLLDDGR